jgi:hypothetical protein
VFHKGRRGCPIPVFGKFPANKLVKFSLLNNENIKSLPCLKNINIAQTFLEANSFEATKELPHGNLF